MVDPNLNIPPIPSKEGTYSFDPDTNEIIYAPKGQTTGPAIGLYFPPEKGLKEDESTYNKRIQKDINRVIGEIETNKDHVDAKARKFSIDNTYELWDTGLSFGSAFKEATKLFKGDKTELKESDLTIPGILVKSAKAGMKEVQVDVVGDLEKGFNLKDFLGKYGPAMNEAIWEFGYGYGKNGITNRHLLYMVYIVKKQNILNAFAGEVMEMLMTKGIYLLYEAILVSKPNITDKDGFFRKLKKYSKTAGKELTDSLKVIQGLFWILISGAVSDFMKDEIEKKAFSGIDGAVKSLLEIQNDNKESRSRQIKNRNYNKTFEDIYKDNYEKIEKALKDGLAKAEKIEIDLSQYFGDFMEKLLDRFNLFRKIFGADRSYTVYNIRNINKKAIKLIQEEVIDGPGLLYGHKIVFAEGVAHGANLKFFGKFEESMKAEIGKPRFGTNNPSLTQMFGELATRTKVGNFGTRKGVQTGVLAAELGYLRRKIVFTDERETEFSGDIKYHGKVDDLSNLVSHLLNTGGKIENVPDFLAYYDQQSQTDITNYIKSLENNGSNQTSLDTPQREKYTLIGYYSEKEDDNGEIEERRISIGYQYGTSELVELVEVVKNKFTEIFEETEDIKLTSKLGIFLSDSKYNQTLNYEFYYVEKTSLEDIAKKKGVIKLEKMRGRLKNNQNYIGDFITTKDIINYNNEVYKGEPYQVGISPEGDYVVLYMSNASVADSNPYFFLNGFAIDYLASSADDVEDVKFPYGEYKDNKDVLYGSANEEQEGTQDKYTFWVGMNSRTEYIDNKDPKKNSNPNGKIVINGVEIKGGKDLVNEKEDRWDKFFGKKNYSQEVENKNGDTLRVEYTYNFNSIGSDELIIRYRFKDYQDWNQLIIKDFVNGDYGITIADKLCSLPGTRSKDEIKKEQLLASTSIDEVTEVSRGKVKAGGKYIKASNTKAVDPEKTNKKEPAKDDRQIYVIKSGDTLSAVAKEYYKDASRWREIEREDGTTYTEEEARKIRPDMKVYIPSADSNSSHQKSKKEKRCYEDKDGFKYMKDERGNLFVNYKDEGGETETLCILGFVEGNYGLWLEQNPPYFLDGDKIVDSEKNVQAPKDKILELEENSWLKEEERIKDGFLWVYGGEIILLPEDLIEEREEEKEESEGSHTSSEAASGSQGEAGSHESGGSDSNSSNDSSSSSSGGSGGKFFLCDGAKLECSMGTEEGELKIIDVNKIYIQGNPMATMNDYKPMVNVKPFGKCKSMANPTVAAATAANYGNLKKMPCVPNIVAPWIKPNPTVTIKKTPTITESSKLMCIWAGNIKVSDPGQDLLKD